MNEQSILKIANYIYENFDDSRDSEIILEQLILVDQDILLQLFNFLSDNKITKNDLIQLDSINNETIKSLILKISLGGDEGVSLKYYYETSMDNALNFNMYKQGELAQFNSYLMNKMIKPTSFMYKPKYDMLNLTVSLDNYNKVLKTYVGSIKVNSLITDTYNKFASMHENSNISIPVVREYIDYAMKNPVFINSPFNRNTIDKFPIYMFLLNRMYKFTSPIIFNNLQSEFVTEMILNNEANRDNIGWTVISDKLRNTNWGSLKSSTFKDIEDRYQRCKLIRVFYSKIYDRYNDISDYRQDEVVQDQLERYFESARDVLISITNVIEEANNN